MEEHILCITYLHNYCQLDVVLVLWLGLTILCEDELNYACSFYDYVIFLFCWRLFGCWYGASSSATAVRLLSGLSLPVADTQTPTNF